MADLMRLLPSYVDIIVEPQDATARVSEPVTCGIPWPQGGLCGEWQLVLKNESAVLIPVQISVLNTWPDGSVRWLLAHWQATVRAGKPTLYRLVKMPKEQPIARHAQPLSVTQSQSGITIETGALRATWQVRANGSIHNLCFSDRRNRIFRVHLSAVDASGRTHVAAFSQAHVSESGPLRTCVRLEGQMQADGNQVLTDIDAEVQCFAGLAATLWTVTLRNSARARHPGGLWDLGDAGSVYLKECSFSVNADFSAGVVACSPETAIDPICSVGQLELYQDSSGGENWNSPNHVNRNHHIPLTFSGYKLSADLKEFSGKRSTPIVWLSENENCVLGIAVPQFWQNFPKALEATPNEVTFGLFPRQSADVHELQGGEQKTHRFWVAFGDDGISDLPLAWTRSPLRVRTDLAWYSTSGAIPYLTPRADDPHIDYLFLVDQALDGENTLEHKREKIDEYGWRHFGDIYGDHECAFHQGTGPIVSHYNNQYDAVAGFAYQFLRSGDYRWWRYMDDLAWHVMDIDTYHTESDKVAYNQGLFWHTYHYVDADTATHRSYPRAAGVCGGGPSAEHLYSTGLMLHYFLTGESASRRAAERFARWVIDIDDGRQTVFAWLDQGPTGLASSSGSPLYHGPGRGSGNAVKSLLDGYHLTRDEQFLCKAEQLIRRVSHPQQDLRQLNLLDAERRWYYTIFLQALGNYLDLKIMFGRLDLAYAYARETLLHYAHWMAEHEVPYLSNPGILEYPTETWAAQDMRKSEVFKYAAKHSGGGERDRYLERAEMFFRYSTETLRQMPTANFCRPVVLMLSYGYMHAYFKRNVNVSAPPPSDPARDFGEPTKFVPQKVRAMKRAVALCVLTACLGLTGLVWLMVIWL